MKRVSLILYVACAAAPAMSAHVSTPAWPAEFRLAPAVSTVQAPDGAVDAAITARLDAFRATQQQAWQAGRFQPLTDFYHEQVRVLPEFHPTLTNRADAVRYHESFAARFAVERYERTSAGRHDLGHRVLDHGTFRQTIVRRSNGERYELAGSYLDLWENRVGHAPHLVTTVWNYDRHPSIESDLRFPEVPGVRMALEAHLPIADDISFELAALNQLLAKVVSEHDGATWARFYADDATLMSNHHPLIHGRAQIERYLTQHAESRPVFEKLDIRHDRIDAFGRYVVEYATHVAAWRNGAHSGVNTGKNVRIWRRGPDGSLRIVWQIGSYD